MSNARVTCEWCAEDVPADATHCPHCQGTISSSGSRLTAPAVGPHATPTAPTASSKPKPAAGWYPDPKLANTKRYWDGERWTEHRIEATPQLDPTSPTQPHTEKKRSGWRWPWEQNWSWPVIIATRLVWITALLVLTGGLSFGFLNGGSDNSNKPKAADPSASTLYDFTKDWTCDDAAKDAVKVSEQTTAQGGVRLLKVREPHLAKDNRTEDMELPTGTNELLVMTCVGTGVWSDGDTTTQVRIKYTVDSDGQSFTEYKPVP